MIRSPVTLLKVKVIGLTDESPRNSRWRHDKELLMSEENFYMFDDFIFDRYYMQMYENTNEFQESLNLVIKIFYWESWT